MRNRGVGKAIFEILKDTARKKDCGRMEWSVLNWNTPSIEFYKNSLGAVPMDEWTVYRLTEF
jgi:GNAT superfamily N-acetyltransferase